MTRLLCMRLGTGQPGATLVTCRLRDGSPRTQADMWSSHRYRADRRAVAQQRQRYLRLLTEIANRGTDFGLARHVTHMNGLPVEDRPATDGAACRHHRKQPLVGFECVGRGVVAHL